MIITCIAYLYHTGLEVGVVPSEYLFLAKILESLPNQD
jgi:hypothetical protein